MERWQKALQKSLTRPESIARHFGIPEADIRGPRNEFAVRITPHALSLIHEKGDPIYRQLVPDMAELADADLFADPLAEDENAPTPAIVHRYPDRVLFLVSANCACYCRFCTRRRKVGDPERINPRHVDGGIAYIADHPEVRDVIVSGGDPLLLTDDALEDILRRLRAIPHVEIIRIHSRAPNFLPQRITAKLVKMLRKYHPLYMNVHFNHPDELVPASVKALGRLADAGIPLGSQTVLLKGVNDDPLVMRTLMQRLLLARVRPYYIFQADMVSGTEHFRTSVERGLEIIEALRGWTSGMAVPYYVIDAPGGGGKIPILPQYVLHMSDREVVIRNYAGRVFRYRQPEGETGAPMVVEEMDRKDLPNIPAPFPGAFAPSNRSTDAGGASMVH